MKNKQFLLFSVFLAALAAGCTATTDTKVGSGAVSSSTPTTTGTVTPTTATLDASSGCVTNVNTAMDSSLPSWIKDNFKCQVAYVSGSTYVFKAIGIPNHKSYYYCSAQTKNGGCTGTKGSLYEALTTTHTDTGTTPTGPSINQDSGTNYGAGTGIISTQNFVMTVPSSPTAKSGSLTSMQDGQSIIGITVNGLSIFNNSAAVGDNLTTQSFTFDNFGGHPDGTNIYHHHSEVPKVSSTMANAALIGIMLDGYAVYDEYCDLGQGAGIFKPNAPAALNTSTCTSSGTANYNPAATPSTFTYLTKTTNCTLSSISSGSATQLDELHGHTTTTKHFSTATYHYHYALDAAAVTNAINYGVLPAATQQTKTLVGMYFRGTPGSSSN